MAAPAPRDPLARASTGAVLQRCACGGGCPACGAKAAASALPINEPGDAYEREADRVADAVMAGGASTSGAISPVLPAISRLQRCACGGSCPACQAACEMGDEHAGPQRESAGTGPAVAPPIVHDVLASPGRPLDAETRSFMEPRFGVGLGGVRVHTDARAAESARAVDAVAYTVGRDVVFAEGRYQPGSPEGRRLLAHELTHVVQQDANSPVVAEPMSRRSAVPSRITARPIQRKEAPGKRQQGPAGVSPPVGFEQAFQKMMTDWGLMDNLKAPVVEKLTKGYMHRGHGPGTTLVAVPTYAVALKPVAAPTELEVYNAIYGALTLKKMGKGADVADWEWNDPTSRDKTREEKWQEIGWFAAEEFVSGKIDRRVVLTTAWVTRRVLGAYVAILTGAAEIYGIYSLLMGVYDLWTSLGEPVPLSAAAQRNADIVAGVKAWLQDEEDKSALAEAVRKPFSQKPNVAARDQTRIGP
jgi:hypothetical protein